jgi:N-acyl amino acid synthase of PEP-CTERM/exosortase system
MARVDFRRARGQEELEEVFRLRYRVYVEEWGFEKAEDHPGGIERDDYDDHAIHFVAEREGVIIGTVRLILNSEQGFPIESFTRIDEDLSQVDRDKVAEISRLAVSKDFRKRARDGLIYARQVRNPPSPEPAARRERRSERRRTDLVTGLYKSMYVESRRLGLDHWYAVIAKGLYLLLTRYGIVFSQIGPEVQYHGLRAPYMAYIPEIEGQVSKANPELEKEFKDALKASKDR